MLLLLPYEIVSHIFLYLSIQDLARVERTCRCFQTWTLCEIERRIKTCSLHEDWEILIHLGHVVVTPARFDIRTKKVFYSVPMDPIRIKTMYDHQRQIHCALTRYSCSNRQRWDYDGLQIILHEGMKEGTTEKVDVQGDNGCELHASLTRLVPHQHEEGKVETSSQLAHQQQQQQQNQLQHNSSSSSFHLITPLPLIYSIQVNELSLPLSKLICVDTWTVYEGHQQQEQ